MTTYEIYKAVINGGDFVLNDIEEKLEASWIEGKITLDEKVELQNLADDKADDTRQIDIPTILADLEQRIARLEAAGVVVWTTGHVTAKGETVLYDVIKEGTLRYCRYDGGRASTSLSPGKINGWVVLDSAGGAVTHTIEKDENGNIILVPVTNEPVEETPTSEP